MKTETADLLVQCGEELGYSMDVWADYSGRGMCGKTTYAVTYASVGELLGAVALAGATAATGRLTGDQINPTELAKELGALRFDTMGRKEIAY